MYEPPAVRRQNRILHAELGSTPSGGALYRWIWSEDLTMPMVMLDDDGNFIKDFLCICGRNKRVHQPECRITSIVPRYEVRKLAPDLEQCWIMARWKEPPDEADWRASFPGNEVPYPAEGTYIPVSSANKAVLYLLPGMTPLPETTWTIIRAVKEHRSRTVQEAMVAAHEAEEKAHLAHQNRLRDQIRDRLTVGLGWPGKKDPIEGQGWIGQAGLGESKPFTGLYDASGKTISKESN